jgi:outer membrane receptor protein involved in Fe transport
LLDLSAWSSRSTSGAPSFGYVFDKIRTSMDNPIETNYDVYGARITYDSPAFSVTNSAGYLDYHNFANLALDVPAFGAPDSAFVQSIGSQVFSDEISFNSTSTAPWRWSVGAMYRRGTERMEQHYTGLFAVIPVLNNDNLSESYAMFGELTRVFDEGRWELTGGLRYFSDDESQDHQTGIGAPVHHAETTATATTPRVVLAWHPNEAAMIYASYAQGFRSGFPPTDAVLVLNPDFPAVKPDRLHNYEIGSKGRLFGSTFSYDAAVYYIKWDDIQQQIGVPFTGSGQLAFFPAQVNGESASGMGVDLSITLQPSTGLSLSAFVGWNDLQMDGQIFSNGALLFDEGDRLNGSPEYTAGASVAYTFPMGASGYEGTIDVSGNYTSEQSYRGIGFPGVSEGDQIQTARAAFTIGSPHQWSLMAFVDNLTNEQGTPTETFVGVVDWSARLRPRTIGLQIEYNFGRH